MSAGRAAAVLHLAIALCAIATEGIAQIPEPQVEPKALLMFNQSLYYDALERPRALAWDAKQKELWVADAGTNRIHVYRPDGVELYAFSSTQVEDPARIAIAPKGQLAVLNGRRTAIHLFDYRGEYRGELKLKELGERPIIGAMHWDSAGQLYVSDNRTSQILVYRPDGSLKFQFGSNGYDEGQFVGVCAIHVGSDGTIYVLDQRALAVQLFDSQGNFLRGWGKHESGKQNFSLPSGIAVDSKGRVFVTDELRQQVKVFSPEGQLLVAFGGIGPSLGNLAFPTDVAVGDQDRVYVAERRTARVQVFEIVETAAALR